MMASDKTPQEKRSGKRLAAILWLVAAVLALTAAALRYFGEGQIKWGYLAATLFMAAMGFSMLRQSRREPVAELPKSNSPE